MAIGGAASWTLAVEIGVYALAIRGGAAPREALLATLASMTVWTALAGSAFALGGLALVAPLASVAWLVVLCFLDKVMTLPAVGKIACILGAMALVSDLAVRCAISAKGRAFAAAVTAAAMMAAIVSPFWTGGLVRLSGPAGTFAVSWAVWGNPFYCVTAAVLDNARFIWHNWGLMYDLSPIRDAGPPGILWYPLPAVCLAAAVPLAAWYCIRRSGRRPQ